MDKKEPVQLYSRDNESDEMSGMKLSEHTSLHPDYTNTSESELGMVDRPFKDQHHILIRAIWNADRFNPKIDEKLRELKQMLKQYDPSMLCDILHDVTGQPIAQATPLLIACFEGDPDVIKLLIESGADVNQTESEHHLTALHVVCDAEYHGQSLRVSILFSFKLLFLCFEFILIE